LWFWIYETEVWVDPSGGHGVDFLEFDTIEEAERYISPAEKAVVKTIKTK